MRSLTSNLTQPLCRWTICNFWSAAVLVVLGVAMCCPITLAQSGAGSIQGTVMDTTGAVVVTASVNVVNQATGVTANTQTNSVGFYQVPGLFTGIYTVTISAPGMRTYKASVQLQVAQAAVISPIMTAGTITQEVEVSADVIQLTTTDNGTLSSTLESNRINQLPMNGRTLLALAGMTTPGLEGTGVYLAQRANGLMGEALEYVADGVPLLNRNFGGAANSALSQLPDPDAVEEVRIETTNTSAMYSEPATGIITTKSGTNQLHGSLFETARNNAVGVAKARQNPSNYAAPHLVRNEFGVSAGGPIILPKAYNGKNKSFWFFAYERYSLRQAVSQLGTVPTTAWRNGDFSGLSNSAGILQQLYDPSTTTSSADCNGSGTANTYCRAPYANNKIPAALLAPASKILYDITPLPTTADNPAVTYNISFPSQTIQTIPTITFRLDHSFNENNKAYLRYTSNDQFYSYIRQATAPLSANEPPTLAADGFPANASGLQLVNNSSFGAAIGFTHIFSPTFFSETILSQQWFQEYVGAGGSNPNLNYEKMLGLPNNFGETGFPGIGGYPATGSNLVMTFPGTQFNYQENQIISNIDENLTKTVARHQMQFGGRYRHERFAYLPDRIPDGIGFTSQTTGLEQPSSGTNYGVTPNTGYQDASFFLGSASNYSVNLQPPVGHFHDMEFDGYFQDNFHVTNYLTVNIGARYEAHPAPWTKYGLAEGFDLKNKAVVLDNPTSYYVAQGYTTQAIITNLTNIGVKFESPSQAGFPSAMLNNYNLNFSPRLGIAYQPFDGKHGTVVRAAYGRFTYPVPVRSSLRNAIANTPFTANYGQSYTSAAQSPDGLPNYLLRNAQSVVMGKNSSGVVNSTSTNAILPGLSATNLAPNSAPDFVTQMNFTIEQPLKANSVLRLTWLWCHGTNLDHYYYYNSSPSTYVWEMAYGIAPPTGGASTIGTNQYATTAMGPYDQVTYGNNVWDVKNGWSNNNALQVNYQRLFHHGIAYQATYVWSKPFRVGGNFSRDSQVYTAQNYAGALGTVSTMTSPDGPIFPAALPPARPAGIAPYAEWHGLDRFETYQLDSAIPKQHISFNGVVDLPFGRGKRWLGNSNRLVDELVGGFQIAGDGSIISQDFQVGGGSWNWGPISPIQTYKHGAPITDCRSGVCHKAYEWFNGYIAPSVVNAVTKGVSGLPSKWQPYQTPIDNTPGTPNYGTNNVQVTAPTLNGGVPVTVPYSPGPRGTNAYAHTFLDGPINYTIDLSLFKVFPITEKMNVRVNIDAFNALNVQGYNNPNAVDGVQNLLSSYNTPRQLQFTMRFTF